ncbi:CHAT domain-containing protein [uncultured Aquimarina sp.]|uniref:CHAT domain-containing protein n=1 Tax=uncultured Aquimarina sp. TaxID=575652 RepID=UPI002608F23D|nr:CHAT domain-containing protein [uncultured Aquimarina sp.]
MNSLKTIALFLFFTGITFSQSKTTNDTLLAYQYFKKADSLLTDRKLDSAIVYFKKALPIYEKVKAWERVAGCFNGVSESYFEYSEYKKSLSFAKSAKVISNKYLDQNNLEKAKAYDNMGQYYLKNVKLSKAQSFFEEALEIQISNENDFGISKSYNNLGQVYTRKNEFGRATEQFKSAIKVDSTKNNPHLAFSYNNLARIYYIQADYYVSIDFMKKAISLEEKRLGKEHPQIARYYNNIGTIYERLGEDDEALSYYKSALVIQLKVSGENHSNIASFYNNISNVLYKKSDLDGSIEFSEKAIKIAKNVHGEYNPQLMIYYTNLSYKYKDKGSFQKAFFYAKKTLEISLKIEKNSDILAKTYHSIAGIYMVFNQYEKALFYSNKAKNIWEESLGENHPNIANSYKNLGQISFLNGDIKQALNYYKKSEKIRVNIFGGDHIDIDLGGDYLNIGELFFTNKQYDSALYYQSKALKIYRKKVSEIDYRILMAYNHLGNSYRGKKEYQQAISYYNKVLDIKDHKSRFEIIENTDFKTFKTFLYACEGKAGIYKDLYFKKKDTIYLKKSIKQYKEADTLVGIIRNYLFDYKEKLLISETAKNVSEGAIRAGLLLYSDNSDKSLLREAYYNSEKSKYNSLKDLLLDSDAKIFSGLSSSLIELEKNLKINKAYYQSKVNEELFNEETDSAKLFSYENKLFDIFRKQDSLTEVLEKNYPKYHQLKYQNEVISVTDVQKRLNDKTTLLEFFTADSTTYAFTISKNKIAVQELSTPKLTERIEQFRASMTKNYEEYKDSSHVLYKKLIVPLKDQFVGNQLIIVPDGPLWHLNFDLLLTQENASNNPKDWPYLLKEYAISYANSATLLFDNEIKEESVSNELRECLAFSFSSGDTISSTRNVSLKAFRSSSMDLPGTREEIKAIANIVDGQYFYGSEATEQNFKKHAGSYNILHLALHGDVDNERPENSKLYFTKSKDTLEDSYLYSHELFALDIPAELTVLSACNTGTGKIAKGEGIMSLGNAFQYAGTKSLLLTNWEISDETTPKIMEYFYTYLKEGKNKAEALQQAKLQFLTTTNEETNHPYYWGGFYLLGDTTAIQFQDNNYAYWLIGFGILALILLSLFWYRKKHSL